MASLRSTSLGLTGNAMRRFRPCLSSHHASRRLYTEPERLHPRPNTWSGEINPFYKVSEEIREAVANKHNAATKPVVALETAIYTHGLHDLYVLGGSVPYDAHRIPLP